MDRREAVRYISLLLGGTLVGAEAFLSGCQNNSGKETFSKDDIAYMDEIADTILPTTKTPGAKAAQVGQFMAVMVKDCYTDKEQNTFRDGLQKINQLSDKQFGNPFMKATPEQRHNLLVQLDKEQKDYTLKKKKEDPPHYFRMMKELSLLGYFTSKIGCTEARRYAPVPGRYDGCVPYKKGDKAWA